MNEDQMNEVLDLVQIALNLMRSELKANDEEGFVESMVTLRNDLCTQIDQYYARVS